MTPGTDDATLAGIADRLATHLGKATGGEVGVKEIRPSVGGACQDNLRVDLSFSAGDLAGERRMVLRSDAPSSLPMSLDRRLEQGVIEAAVAGGVRTPAARFLGEGIVREGAHAYLMDFAAGEAIGRKVLRDADLAGARKSLPGELAQELARIHSVTPPGAAHLFDGAPPPTDPARETVARLKEMVAALPQPRPALDLALKWLEANAPAPSEVVLVHGDFRTGNFLVTPNGLSAILDWEFSRWSAPEEDLGWISVRDWRFGVVEKPVGGFADRADFWRAYAEASGREVEAGRVHFWEVLGNVRWGAGSIHQALRYLSGQRDLELLAIARRACEMEYEALRLIERGPPEVRS